MFRKEAPWLLKSQGLLYKMYKKILKEAIISGIAIVIILSGENTFALSGIRPEAGVRMKE